MLILSLVSNKLLLASQLSWDQSQQTYKLIFYNFFFKSEVSTSKTGKRFYYTFKSSSKLSGVDAETLLLYLQRIGRNELLSPFHCQQPGPSSSHSQQAVSNSLITALPASSLIFLQLLKFVFVFLILSFFLFCVHWCFVCRSVFMRAPETLEEKYR